MKLRAFRSRRVVTPEGTRPAALLVDGETIGAVLAPEAIPAGATTRDFGDLAILPGLVDSHVHINEPGRSDWEGFETATRAAAAGGFTLLVDMPLNCLPPTTTVAALEVKRACARNKCLVDWALWGGVESGNQEHIGDLAKAGVRGFKCFLVHPGIDGLTMVSEPELRAALPHVAKTGLPLLVHAELPGPIEAASRALEGADWRKYDTYLRSRPDEAELAAIELLLALCREFHFPLHIVHLATGNAVGTLREAKAAGLPISVETCPHYLYFSAEEIADGATSLKCAPPIRGTRNRNRLWEALREGVIDLVVTDHSPCPAEMKRLGEGDFRAAWGGIPGLSLALPVLWTESKARGCSLPDLARWMSERPAALAGFAGRKGRIAPGYDADFVVFDPDAERVVTQDLLYYRHRLSPYLGRPLKGVVSETYLRGQRIFAGGEFQGAPGGRELSDRGFRDR
jgi:allantoinase